MNHNIIRRKTVVGVVCLLMVITMPIASCINDSEISDNSFNWIKGRIFLNCHIEVTADETKGDAEVGNAPPILVWSTVSGNVEITTPLRHKTMSGNTKGILIHSAGPYGNDPFYIDRNAAICIVTEY